MNKTVTSCRKSVYQLTQTTGLYNLSDNSMISKELESYLAALEPLEMHIRRFVAGRFIMDCDSKNLEYWEKMLEMSAQPQDNEDVRQQALISRLSISEDSFTIQGMSTSIRSAGIEAIFEEKGEELVVKGQRYLNTYSGIDEITKTMELFLPAHISASLNLGVMTWDMFEQKMLTFDVLDKVNFDWEFFDTCGEKIGLIQ